MNANPKHTAPKQPVGATAIILLGALAALGPLSTDVTLPALPGLAKDLNVQPAAAQLTLGCFLVGLAAGLPFYGPLSDRFGRRPLLMCGLALYVTAGGLCVAAPSLDILLPARFLQGLGACAGVALSRAAVRDLHDGKQAGRLMSLMSAAMGFVPVVGPPIGGYVYDAYGWRAAFALVAVVGVLIAAAVAILLPETRKPDQKPRELKAYIKAFPDIFKQAEFRQPAAIVCAAYGGLFAFISGSPFTLANDYGVAATEFGIYFGITALGYVTGALSAAKLSVKIGVAKGTRFGGIALCIGGIVMATPHATGIGNDSVTAFVTAAVIYAYGFGIAIPLGSAAALEKFPDNAGAAASLLGISQMTAAVLLGASSAALIVYGPLALAALMSAAAIACLVAAFAIQDENSE